MEVLTKIYQGNDKIQQTQQEQLSMLQKMYGVQVATLKEQEEENKRAERDRQKDKRKKADRGTKKKNPLDELVGKLKPKDKKKGILGKIMDALPALIGGAALLKGLGAALLTAVGAGITAYFTSEEFRTFVNESFTKLTDKIFGENGILGPENREKIFEGMKTAVIEGVTRLFDFITDQMQNLVTGLGGSVVDAAGNAINKGVMGENYKVSDSTKKAQETKREAQVKFGQVNKPGSESTPEERKEASDELRRTQEIVKLNALIDQATMAIKNFNDLRDDKDPMTGDLLFSSKTLDANIAHEEKRIKEARAKIDALGMQTGGFVGRVPNQGGNGDRFPAMLQAGSVVLNQRASGFQSGGMVPTMLEQGERVFSPKDPMAGAALMLNSMIPRFQNGGLVKDPKTVPPGKAERSHTFEQGKITNGPIKEGGYIKFIGDGSGFTGELKFFDGTGKEVGSYGGISGQGRRAKTTQDQRMNNPGQMNPLPDGSYPIESPMGPGSGAVGSFAAWINNPTGTVGRRSQLFLHNDIGSDGTAGCIGVELGGQRGPNDKTKKFVDFYNKVRPQRVDVDLMSSGGKKFAPGMGTPSGMTGFGAWMESIPGIGGVAGPMVELLSKLSVAFGEVLMEDASKEMAAGGFFGDALKGFGGFMTGFGQLLGAPETTATGGSAGQATGAQQSDMGIVGSMGFSQEDWDLYRNTVAQIESGGKYNIAGGSGGHYDGRYQLGAAAKTDGARYAGISDPGHSAAARAAFREDAAMQEKLFAGFTKANHTYLMGNSEYANASNQRKLQILGYAHNQGMGGAANWMKTGVVGSDGFGTKGTKYTDSIAAEFNKRGYQSGGVAQVRSGSAYGSQMVQKTMENFMSEVAGSNKPVIIPVNMPGSSGGGEVVQSNNSGEVPVLPSQDSSIVSMEYKYRITMGASV